MIKDEATATKKSVSTAKEQAECKYKAQTKIDFSRVSDDIKDKVYTYEVCLREIGKLEKAYDHNDIYEKKKELTKLMNACVVRILDIDLDGEKTDLYAAYKQMIELGKRGDFLRACAAFM